MVLDFRGFPLIFDAFSMHFWLFVTGTDSFQQFVKEILVNRAKTISNCGKIMDIHC